MERGRCAARNGITWVKQMKQLVSVLFMACATALASARVEVSALPFGESISNLSQIIEKGSGPSIEDSLYMIRMPADCSLYTIYTFYTASSLHLHLYTAHQSTILHGFFSASPPLHGSSSFRVIQTMRQSLAVRAPPVSPVLCG